MTTDITFCVTKKPAKVCETCGRNFEVRELDIRSTQFAQFAMDDFSHYIKDDECEMYIEYDGKQKLTLDLAKAMFAMGRAPARPVHLIGLATFRALEKELGFDAAKTFISNNTSLSVGLALYLKEKEKK